eukprot:4178510-Prymnesium_polylepis.3
MPSSQSDLPAGQPGSMSATPRAELISEPRGRSASVAVDSAHSPSCCRGRSASVTTHSRPWASPRREASTAPSTPRGEKEAPVAVRLSFQQQAQLTVMGEQRFNEKRRAERQKIERMEQEQMSAPATVRRPRHESHTQSKGKEHEATASGEDPRPAALDLYRSWSEMQLTEEEPSKGPELAREPGTLNLFFNCLSCPFDVYGNPGSVSEVFRFPLKIRGRNESQQGAFDAGFTVQVAKERDAPFEKRIAFRDVERKRTNT